MNAKKILPLIALLLFGQCSMLQSDDNDDDTALALLLGISAGCVLGGQSFTPSEGVVCSGGMATGTGTLTANSQADDIYLQITPSFSGSGSISIFALANGSDATTGVTSKITPSGGTPPYQVDDAHNLDDYTVSFTTSLCYEVHGDHEHLMVKADSCSGSAAEEPNFSGTPAGESWGFVLTMPPSRA